jgi:hypothetical protein
VPKTAGAVALLTLGLIQAAQAPARYVGPGGALRNALAKQPFSPNGLSKGPDTMANGGIQQTLAALNTIVHIDMDVLDPREVMDHGNKVPGGPSSDELARLFEEIFRRYSKASAIGFAAIPSRDEGGLSIAAVNRMVTAAVKGVQAR